MALGIMLILFSSVMTAEGILIQVVILDYYPVLYGMQFFFYGIAGIFLIWGVIDLAMYRKRRKRRILRGQLRKGLEIKAKLPPKTTKIGVKSSICAGQLNLPKTSKPNNIPKKSGIYRGQSKKGAK